MDLFKFIFKRNAVGGNNVDPYSGTIIKRATKLKKKTCVNLEQIEGIFVTNCLDFEK